MKAVFAALMQGLVPWRKEKGAFDDAFVAQLVAGMASVFGSLAAVFIVFFTLHPAAPPGLLRLCIASVAIHATNLWLVRERSRVPFARWAVSIELLVLMTAYGALTVGYRSYGSGWQLCVPLFVMFLLGVRYGIVFGVAIGLEGLAFWRLEELRIFIPPSAYLELPPAMEMIGDIAMLVTVIALGVVYEWAHGARRAALARTIEELELAHKQLADAQQRLIAGEKLSSLGLLAAGVAHEINNPMAFITANVSALARDLDELCTDSDLRVEYAHEVLPATLDGIRRVNAIVGDLRRFARGDQEVFVEYDLNAEIAAALRIAHPQLTKRQARLDLSLGALPPVHGLPRQVMQVVLNLVVNAAQAGPPGSSIRIASWATSDEVAIKVQDTGVGMNAETVAKLFQPFFTTKPAGEGTGLGLALVHGIVSRHSGRIEVESSPGRGTAFTVWLPHMPPVLARSAF